MPSTNRPAPVLSVMWQWTDRDCVPSASGLWQREAGRQVQRCARCTQQQPSLSHAFEGG